MSSCARFSVIHLRIFPPISGCVLSCIVFASSSCLYLVVSCFCFSISPLRVCIWLCPASVSAVLLCESVSGCVLFLFQQFLLCESVSSCAVSTVFLLLLRCESVSGCVLFLRYFCSFSSASLYLVVFCFYFCNSPL